MVTQSTAPLVKVDKAPSERFTSLVIQEFQSTVGEGVSLTPEKKVLAQHLFIKVDTALKELEAKRLKAGETNKQPIIWQNVNMQKLAMSAMHRVELGLDALADNHISPIPYWNGKENKYDLELRIGYAGKDYYKRKFAIDAPDFPPIYQLVYSTDTFKPLMKNAKRDVESYEFEVNNPFSRGEVIGGFAYYMYKDSTKNKLILVSEEDFKKSEAKGNATFWRDHPIPMRYKTIVNRATSKLNYDPSKTPKSYHVVEAEEDAAIEAEFRVEVEENANQKTLDIPTTTMLPAAQGEVKEEKKSNEPGW